MKSMENSLIKIYEEVFVFMPKETERVRLMKENFIRLHQQGLSISQIAKMFNVSEPTVYSNLEKIARMHGISRESLLQEKRESKRVKDMKENFMRCHQEGLTIPQIAENFNVSSVTIYRTLEEISQKNNVNRESLLDEMKEDAQVRLMRENFMKMREQGMTITEIAQKCDVSRMTVYKKLQRIASENGVSRESLLSRTPKNKK